MKNKIEHNHVTFFLNGGVDTAFPGEDRILVPSTKVRVNDLQPEMSASKVTGDLAAAITGGKYDNIICNYANCDMVRHTGILDAAILAVEAVDALGSVGGQRFRTADHGNIEQMVDKQTGQPRTALTTIEFLRFMWVVAKYWAQAAVCRIWFQLCWQC
jgi:2,3-bisphosphoglycerate-independent phosphoglycerate mutase